MATRLLTLGFRLENTALSRVRECSPTPVRLVRSCVMARTILDGVFLLFAIAVAATPARAAEAGERPQITGLRQIDVHGLAGLLRTQDLAAFALALDCYDFESTDERVGLVAVSIRDFSKGAVLQTQQENAALSALIGPPPDGLPFRTSEGTPERGEEKRQRAEEQRWYDQSQSIVQSFAVQGLFAAVDFKFRAETIVKRMGLARISHQGREQNCLPQRRRGTNQPFPQTAGRQPDGDTV